MSSFEIAKETMMLLITMLVLVFVSVFFYVVLGSYKVGSEVDVSYRENELVALRAMKCIENNEKLDECIKTERYGVKIKKGEDEIAILNKGVYDRLKVKDVFGFAGGYTIYAGSE